MGQLLIKHLYIARHAKSSWKAPNLSDFDRPLNKRGKRDAPFLANVISKKIHNVDLIISSPAERAKVTAQTFAQFLKYPLDSIDFNDKIYFESTKSILKILKSTKSNINSVMIFGHNPDLTSLANYLSDSYIDNIPTCGVVGLEIASITWSELGESTAKQIFFEYPKKYKQN